MNYFELHIGDYQRKTAHLTLAEHGAYVLMLQTFYASERPLPADRKVLHRLLRADTPAERKAVDSVTAQFWQKDDQGLTNKRAERVLDDYKRWVDKQKANGSKGGRPKETQGLTQSEPNGGDSHLNSPSRPPTKTSHPPPKPPHAAPNGSRPERGGDCETDSGWKPPTEEQIRAGY